MLWKGLELVVLAGERILNMDKVNEVTLPIPEQFEMTTLWPCCDSSNSDGPITENVEWLVRFQMSVYSIRFCLLIGKGKLTSIDTFTSKEFGLKASTSVGLKRSRVKDIGTEVITGF